MTEVEIFMLAASCGLMAGFIAGVCVAWAARDHYWIQAADRGVRAYARGKLYTVREDKS